MVLRTWDLESIEGLDRDGEAARDRLLSHLAKSERVARRLVERRQARAEAELAGV
jgi:acyl-[acyl-carrier-protein] desaturase